MTVAGTLAGGQVAFFTGDKVKKEKKLNGLSNTTLKPGYIPELDAIYYNMADAMTPYHLTPTGDPLIVIFVQKVNNMIDRVIELNSHLNTPDSIFAIYLHNYAQSIEEVAIAFDNTGMNFSITRADVQYFKDSCATGHLPYLEDIACANAGLSEAQRSTLATYFASIPLYLTEQSVSMSAILHAEANDVANLQTWVPAPTLTQWGFIILMLLMVSTSVWILIRRRHRLSA